ncbi:hypothetical protein BXZ70DRAFT_361519 [Cristinia sonorae]|uniref:MYND-type domain-containing protein n=1 Tax=Cristinia sonorae TaxID=1940300 RepID=A0A8K0XNB9_9AGAR|nr:hypothetical protein BXZ70DRAFT_361519 [Cristinia sonorae]
MYSGEGMESNLLRQLGAMMNTGQTRSLEELIDSDEQLRGMESMLLRTFTTSECMEPRRDLDDYGRTLFYGDLKAVKADFARRVAAARDESDRPLPEKEATRAAAQQIYELHWGPTRVPVFDLLFLATMIVPGKRAEILAVTKWLAIEAKVPVNGLDLSGSTATHHTISTKPGLDLEFAQILYDAGGDVGLRNRFGETAVCEALKIFEPREAETMRKATEAIRWYLTHGGNIDLKDNDGISARGMMELSRNEDKRRLGLEGRCCAFCALGPQDGGALLVCSRCRSARYCRPPRNCQTRDWPRHKTECKNTRK